MRTAGREKEERRGKKIRTKKKEGERREGRKAKAKYTYTSKSNMHFKIKHTMLGNRKT